MSGVYINLLAGIADRGADSSGAGGLEKRMHHRRHKEAENENNPVLRQVLLGEIAAPDCFYVGEFAQAERP